MEIALGLLVAAIAVGFVILPLIHPRPSASAGDGPGPAASPDVRRAAIYREILELELDHRVGKLDEADYRELSEACLARAAALLAEEERDAGTADEQIEREVRAMRESLRRSAAVPVGEGERG